jgi:ribosomal protein L16 Arg81 hydroxylase
LAARNKSALSKLLHPLTGPRFLERYWTQRPLVVRGSPRRLPALFHAPELQTLADLLDASPGRIRTWFTDERGAAQSVVVSAAAARTLYLTRRLTVVVDGLRVPAVSELMARMKKELQTLQSPIGANAYASPAGVTTRMHFDEQDVFLVQVRGRKRWRYAPQTQIRFPPQSHFGAKVDVENALIAAHLPGQMPARARSVVLRPGDVLYLPAGTWHEAHALDDSIGVTLTFPNSSWLELLLLRLRARLLAREEWRAPSVGILAPPSPLQARALATFDKLVRELAEELASVELEELLTQ